MIRMAGDAGVVENQQALGAEPHGQPGDLAGRPAGRDLSQVAVGVIEQGDGGQPELGGGLAEFLLPGLVQCGVVLVQRGSLAMGEAQHVNSGTARW